MKTVFVTGSSSGIGLKTAEIFLNEGFKVYINGRNEDRLNSAAKRLKNAIPLLGDVSDYDTAEKFFAEIGDIDVLVNNAGISYLGLFNLMEHKQWEDIIKINLFGAMNCSNLAVKRMIPRQSGTIINISSIWGISGASCEVAYSASKGALNSFTKALAKELAPSGIRVNAIACGVIDTKMNDFLTEEEKQSLTDEIPAGRFGTTAEVAELAAFLASSKAQYLNGQIITMDGAML